MFLGLKTHHNILIFPREVWWDDDLPQVCPTLVPEAVGGRQDVAGREEAARALLDTWVPQTAQLIIQWHCEADHMAVWPRHGKNTVMLRGCLTIHGNCPSFALWPPMILGVLVLTSLLRPQGWGAARLRRASDGETAMVRKTASRWGHVFLAPTNIPWVPDLVQAGLVLRVVWYCDICNIYFSQTKKHHGSDS